MVSLCRVRLAPPLQRCIAVQPALVKGGAYVGLPALARTVVTTPHTCFSPPRHPATHTCARLAYLQAPTPGLPCTSSCPLQPLAASSCQVAPASWPWGTAVAGPLGGARHCPRPAAAAAAATAGAAALAAAGPAAVAAPGPAQAARGASSGMGRLHVRQSTGRAGLRAHGPLQALGGRTMLCTRALQRWTSAAALRVCVLVRQDGLVGRDVTA